MSDAVDHLALLAGLDLDADERRLLRERLDALSSLLERLPDAPDLEPSAVALVPREDAAGPSLAVDVALGSAPSRAGGWLDCPAALDEEE